MSDSERLDAPPTTPDVSGAGSADPAHQPEPPAPQPADSALPFFDPAGLAPELQGRYHDMQAAFTQKTQALAEERRQIAELRTRAAQWDALSRDASFTTWLQTRHLPPADTAPAALTAEQMVSLLQDPAQFERYILDKAKAMARAELQPVRQQTDQFLARQELKTFADTHPDYALYRDTMIPLVEQGYTLGDAYKLAKHDVLIRDAVDKALKDFKANAAGGRPELKSQASTHLTRHGKKQSWDEAVAAAEAQLATP